MTARVLIIHNEARYFAGAERVLNYFLQGAAAMGLEVALAAPGGSRILNEAPAAIPSVILNDDRRRFSPGMLTNHLRSILHSRSRFPFDLVHGWAARDWELTSLAGLFARTPALGTLHDHPNARFLSGKRHRLMRWTARIGLGGVACVSEAVQRACMNAGYPRDILHVVHNGLPRHFFSEERTPRTVGLRIGFLGAFTERKGLRGLFEIISDIENHTSADWSLILAGGAQDPAGEAMIGDIRDHYSGRPWWHRVHWPGWIDDVRRFLASLDVLICPSTEFDPLPTVLLEAGAAGTPVLAAAVGGVAEIVHDGRTGWLFTAGDWKAASLLLARVLDNSCLLLEAGREAQDRVRSEFSIERMVSAYAELYSELKDRPERMTVRPE